MSQTKPDVIEVLLDGHRWLFPTRLFTTPHADQITTGICRNCKGSGNIRTRGKRLKFHSCSTCAGTGTRWKPIPRCP